MWLSGVSLVLWTLFGLSCAQWDELQDPNNYFIEPPSSDLTAWDHPWVLEDDKPYTQNSPINVTWATNKTAVDIALWKYDNNTNKGLGSYICTARTTKSCYWNGIMPSELQVYAWPNNVYFFVAYVASGDSIVAMSHYFNITNVTTTSSTSSTSMSSTTPTAIMSTTSNTLASSTSATTPTSTATNSGSGSHSKALAGGIGGGIGACVLIAAVLTTLFCMRRRRRSARDDNIYLQDEQSAYQPSHYAPQSVDDNSSKRSTMQKYVPQKLSATASTQDTTSSRVSELAEWR